MASSGHHAGASPDVTVVGMRIPSLRPVPVVLLATAALCVSAGGGAVAGSVITGKQIKDGTVTTKDVKDKTLTAKDISPKALAALQGEDGTDGAPGAPGAEGAPGAPGIVRAYGLVVGTDVTRQSGGITATSSDGVACVDVPGINAQLTSAVVTVDYSNDSTGDTNQAYAELASGSGGCPSSQFRVVTFLRNASTGAVTYTPQGFYIFVA